MADEKIIIQLELDKTQADRVLKALPEKAEESGEKASKNFSDSFGAGFATMAAKASLALGAIGAGFIIKGAIEAASKVENLSTQFSTLLGSTTLARQQMEKLSSFAASTPFQLEGIASASKQLLSFGFTQEESIKNLESLGDAAAASGSGIGELAQIFGQVRAAGKLTGERLLQLQERAIPIGSVLAKSLGVAETSVRKLVSTGQVKFKDFEKAFKSLSSEGGIFSGGMKKLSETTTGLFSTLKDNIFLTLASLGKQFEPFIKAILKNVTTIVQDFRKTVDFKEVILSVINFGRAINDFVILPFIIARDTSVLAFKALRNGVQEILNFLVSSTKSVAETLNFGGVFDDFLKDISTVESVIGETTEEMRKDLSSTFEGAFDTDFSEKADAFLQGMAETVEASNIIVNDLKKIDPTIDTAQLEESAITMSSIYSDLSANFSDTAGSMVKTSKVMAVEISKSMINVMGRGVASAFASFGAALAKGENAMQALLKGFTGMLGDMAIQMGTMLIAQAAAMFFSPNPAWQAQAGPLLAAGASLAAVGGAIKAFSGGGGGSSASASGGGAGGESFGFTPLPDDLTAQTKERVEPETRVAVNIQGDVLDSDETSLRIVTLLQDALDVNGATVV